MQGIAIRETSWVMLHELSALLVPGSILLEIGTFLGLEVAFTFGCSCFSTSDVIETYNKQFKN